MKKISYIVLLAIAIIFLSTCRKKPELKIYNLELSEETVIVSTNSVTISTEYSYPGEVLAVKLLLSTFSDMSGSTEHETTVSNTTISVTLENLNDNTTYYYRYRYANGIAWVDTEIKNFTTEGYTLPTVTTDEVSDVTSNTARCGGEATDAGNGNISAKGFCYSTNQNPTIYHNVINCGDSLGVFEAIIENLDINTTYYVRAFATNEKGTGYGEQKSFTTLGQVPTVVTIPITSITATTAVSGGTITDNGGNEVTEKGVCWSTEQYPTTDSNHTSDGTGNGAYVSNLTDLLPNTTYYVRAYATNSQGTGYGNELTFTTSASLPVLTTKSVTEITENSAKSGGNITNNGGMDITARGICWSTEHNPTTNDAHTIDGEGVGEYDSEITALSANVKYYVRAYATNDYGTAYGNEVEFTTAMGMPSVTTKSVTGITAQSASCGGDVTNSGGGNITARGVCWSTAQNPTINDSHTSDGTGTGEFTSSITGLTYNVTYYVRAYATNSNGTAYGEERSFMTQEGLAVVVTADVTNVTATSASSGGEVTDDGGFSITARGVCWSTNQNPTTNDAHTSDGTGTGSYTSSLSSLSYNTTYYVRAYATNSKGTSYGEEKTFTTSKLAPTVTTNDVTSITFNSAVCGGEVTNDGGAEVTSRGICWSTSQNPTISNNHTSDGNGLGVFTSNITGLTENTTYYVRAYATNSEGTNYGEQKTFTTQHDVVVPTVTTNNVTNISTNSATCGGDVMSAGYGTVSARGICWSTSQNPTVSNPHTTDGTGTGSFTSSITGLTENTTYYVRAYATNEAGTAYGEQKTFTTPHATTLPTVTTSNVTDVTQTTATSGGNVTSEGYGIVSAKGVCWSTSQNPTISDAHTTDGTGTGSFTSSITGLTENTTYYVRAYATNEAGTAYGEQKSFTTPHATTLPTVTTNNVTEITQTTAVSGGNVTSSGYGTVSARGVCWSTSQNPTISDSHTSDGIGVGSFVSSLSGLAENTTYYVRAYATNEVGTVYGEQKTFTTLHTITLPTVTTSDVTDITQTTATSGGNVTSAGYGIVSARGVCWSASQNPTINDSHTNDGSGVGAYTSSIDGLTANTTYYVRAYATNEAGTVYGEQVSFTTEQEQPQIPTGAINGLFSVSATQQVYFSQGNLQYIGSASNPYWKFADNQWDCLGDNGQGGINQSVDRDYFGWGTSGYNHGAVCFQPWCTEFVNSYYYAYGQPNYCLNEQTGMADWGYNPISNGGNQPNQWRTLTMEEWTYVLNTRMTVSGIRYAKAQLNDVNGLVLLPDNWEVSFYVLNNTNTAGADFSSNVIDVSQWVSMEQQGAVFLPAAGERYENTINAGYGHGYYWSASSCSSELVYRLDFEKMDVNPQYRHWRRLGHSVRLVQDYNW